MAYGFDPLTDAMYEAARKLCENSDALVGHFFLFPLAIAAEKRNVPLAKVYVVHNCIPSPDIAPPGVPLPGKWAYALGWRLVRSGVNRVFLPRVNALRQREGLPLERDVILESWPSRILNLVAVSPTIAGKPGEWSEEYQVCGFLTLPRASEERDSALDAFLSAGPPPVYFTFGSMMVRDVDYMASVVGTWRDAVRRLRCRAVFQIAHEDLTVFPTSPQIFKVKRSDYPSVFPRCAAVVHHGGAGTTQSVLEAGRPSVVVAHLADQFFWGAELERLGVAGRTIKRPRMTRARLVRSLEEVLSSETMARKAAVIGAAISREKGTQTAVRLLEQYFAGIAPSMGDTSRSRDAVTPRR